LRYVNTCYGLFDLHFGLIRWVLHEPNFIYLAHRLVPTETLSGLADPPTFNLEDPPKMRSLRCKWVRGTTLVILTQTRKTDLPCHEIGRLVAASLSKPSEDRCVCVALLLLACRFLGQSFGGFSSCPHRRRFCRLILEGKRQAPVRTPSMKSNPLGSEGFRV
jgi:hypothetical protein